MDSSYETPDGREKAFFTVHLYLNEDTPGEALDGGATVFHSRNRKESLRVLPKIGRVLIFQQRGLLHSGEDVHKGTKVTMRTEIMYTQSSPTSDDGFQS